jgi:small-conductance mechanosensitive channel
MDTFAPTLKAWFEDPRIAALAWIVGALTAAKLAEWILVRVVARLARKTRTDLDDRVADALRRPVFLTVLALGGFGAVAVLDPGDPWRYAIVGGLRTACILVWAVALARIGILLLQAAGTADGRLRWVEPRTLPLFENLWKLALTAAAIYLFLGAWNLDVTPWLASAGIAGIALGFAAKDTLANLFSGLFILADAPYKIGDYIVLDGGERGEVTAIGLRSTPILTLDDVEVTVPNAIIANAKIINESGGPWEKARVTVHVGVAYGSDVEAVSTSLLRAAAQVELLARDPAPRVRFTRFGDSSLDFRLLCWVEGPAQRGLALHELNTRVYENFRDDGIEIPFPQRVVHWPEGDARAGRDDDASS